MIDPILTNVKPLYICIRCGDYHGMGIENRETGEFTPIDVCNKCLFIGTCIPPKEQVCIEESVSSIPNFMTQMSQETFNRIVNGLEKCQ